MRSLLLVSVVICVSVCTAVFADDSDACFILPSRIARGKSSASGTVINFGRSNVWFTVESIGRGREGPVQKLIGCGHHATFRVPDVSRVSEPGKVLLQLNATFIDGEMQGKCGHRAEGDRKRRAASDPPNVVTLYTEIPVVDQAMVLIQLSHPVYNPGDYVKYRILLTEGLIRPLERTDSPLNVTVSLRHELQHSVESKALQLHPGEIYSGQYLLADDRDLGSWNLTVTVGDDQTTTKPFEVVQQSSPVHHIVIDVREMTDSSITLCISARYTFGSPINGTMTVILVGGDFPYTSAPVRQVLGHTTYKIPMDKILDSMREHTEVRTIDVTVTVNTSNGYTGRTHRQTKRIAVHPDAHRLTLRRMVSFVPGLNASLLVQLSRLDGKPFVRRDDVWATVERWDDDHVLISTDTYKQPVQRGGTAVLSVPTTDTTASVSFKVQYNSLESSFQLEPAYEPELFVRIRPGGRNFKLGIASSHRLAELITIARYQSVEQSENIDSTAVNTDATYFERERGPMNGLKSVHVFAKLFDSDMMVQTSVSHVDPSLPRMVNIMMRSVNDEQEISVTSASQHAAVGVAIYEGLLDLESSINMHLMFNGTRCSTVEEFHVESVGQVFVTPSTSFDQNDRDGNVQAEKPCTTFNRLLLWKEGTISPKDLIANFRYKPPAHVNQITVTAFAFSNTTGLDVAPPMHWVRSKLDIHVHVPYAVNVLEPVTVDVYVVNHNSYTIPLVLVQLLNTANEFTFLNNSGRIDATHKTIYGRLEPNEVQRAEFLIRPKKLGSIFLKAIAYSNNDMLAADEIVLRTVPENELKTEVITRTFTVQDSVASFREKLSTSPGAVPGSEKNSLVVHHEQNKLAALSTSMLLDQLVEADPFTMVVKASVTLDVLRLARLDWPERHTQATTMVNDSLALIERLAKPDGSFGAGNYDRQQRYNSVCWDTVVAVQALMHGNRQLAPGKSRNDALASALGWLNKRQASEGYYCGQEIADVEGRTELTAHVLMALARTDEHAWMYVSAIDGARRYLTHSLPELRNPYHQALVGYAVQFSGRIKTGTETDSLVGSTASNALQELWQQRSSTRTQSKVWWSSGSGHDLEITSYALLLLTARKQLLEAAPLVNWIKRQPYKRLPLGVTPNAHVALRALLSYAEYTSFLPQQYNALVVASDRNKVVFRASLQHGPTGHVLSLPPTTRSVNFTINGTITGAIEITHSYLQSVDTQTRKFDVRISRYDESSQDYVYWSVCVRFQPKGAFDRTRMVTCEISFPSGYIALDDSVDELEELDDVVAVILRNHESQLVITFEELTMEGRCFNVTGFRRMRATQLLPGTIKVFDLSDATDAAFKTFDVEH